MLSTSSSQGASSLSLSSRKCQRSFHARFPAKKRFHSLLGCHRYSLMISWGDYSEKVARNRARNQKTLQVQTKAEVFKPSDSNLALDLLMMSRKACDLDWVWEGSSFSSLSTSWKHSSLPTWHHLCSQRTRKPRINQSTCFLSGR